MKSIWVVVLFLSCGNTLAMSGMGFLDEPLAVCDAGGSTINTGPEVIGNPPVIPGDLSVVDSGSGTILTGPNVAANPSSGLSTVETAEDGTVRVQQQPVEP